LTTRFRTGVDDCELGKIEHVRDDVYSRANDYGPGRCLVECDVLVKRHKRIQRGTTKERDKIPADREENKDDINVKHERWRTSEGWRRVNSCNSEIHI
jgi:hypothetical protein